MDNYELVREKLAQYGVRGTTFNQLLEDTGLTKDELYQTIGHGFRTRGFEQYFLNGVEMIRNRPTFEQLYKKRRAQFKYL